MCSKITVQVVVLLKKYFNTGSHFQLFRLTDTSQKMIELHKFGIKKVTDPIWDFYYNLKKEVLNKHDENKLLISEYLFFFSMAG